MGLPLNNNPSAAPLDKPEAAQGQDGHDHSTSTHAGVDAGRPRTEAQLEADRLYEEAMEEEYAKREGGA